LKSKNETRRLDYFHALDAISFQVAAGELFTILGPTGYGKTLILESIAGLMPIHSGRIRIDGRDVTDLPPERRQIGIVYQDQSLFPTK
jgi:molybdate/tungstate transport system ATP-binding protein